MKATVKDMRAAGVCSDARFWFEENGLDWRAFVLEGGISISTLLATGNVTPDVQKTIDATRERYAREAK